MRERQTKHVAVEPDRPVQVADGQMRLEQAADRHDSHAGPPSHYRRLDGARTTRAHLHRPWQHPVAERPARRSFNVISPTPRARLRLTWQDCPGNPKFRDASPRITAERRSKMDIGLGPSATPPTGTTLESRY